MFIGGLGDGLLTTGYTSHLGKRCGSPKYSFVEVLLSSSYAGWGTSDLGQDVRELSQCVEYFRQLRPRGKIVFMGHSTGCQDVMHYLLDQAQHPKVDGAIMQAGISDREAITMVADPIELRKGVDLAQTFVKEGREDDVLPNAVTSMILPGPISAKRWLSLVSPGPEHAGEDDYFSSDFDDERLKTTFGKIGKARTPILILYSGSDAHVPDFVDKQLLLDRWVKHIKDGGGIVDQDSAVIPDASHTLKGLTKPAEEVMERVLNFLSRLKQES